MGIAVCLYFDGSVKNGHGTWAVALHDKGITTLLDYGYIPRAKIHSTELRAAREAMEYARKLGVELILGDCRVSLERMEQEDQARTWKWVPSRDNLADRFTKEYRAQ